MNVQEISDHNLMLIKSSSPEIAKKIINALLGLAYNTGQLDQIAKTLSRAAKNEGKAA